MYAQPSPNDIWIIATTLTKPNIANILAILFLPLEPYFNKIAAAIVSMLPAAKYRLGFSLSIVQAVVKRPPKPMPTKEAAKTMKAVERHASEPQPTARATIAIKYGIYFASSITDSCHPS